MKKKILFCAALAVALGVGAVTASHISSNDIFGLLAKDNVESMASCEYGMGGFVFYQCTGSTNECYIIVPDGLLFCSGTRVYN